MANNFRSLLLLIGYESKNMRKIILFTALIVAMTGTALNAQIVTDRPDQTESSSTVPGGALQLETGVLVSYDGNSHISTRQILLPTTLLRYGITNGVELRVVNQLESIKFNNEKYQGISDLEVGTKIQIIKNEERNIEVAFLTHLIIPTGATELSGGKYGTSNKISVSHALNDNVGVGYNVGYNYFGVGSGDLTYSLVFGIGVNEKVSVYVEPYGEITDFTEFVSYIDAGFTYLVKENFQLDFSFGSGINKRMNFVSTGFSWLIVR